MNYWGECLNPRDAVVQEAERAPNIFSPDPLEGTSPTHILTLVILVRLTLDSGLKLKENTFVLTSNTQMVGIYFTSKNKPTVSHEQPSTTGLSHDASHPSPQPPVTTSTLPAFNPSPTRQQDQPNQNPALIGLRRQWVGRNGPKVFIN